ncbi:hypothetical protein ABFV99_14700 [Cytobacillus horneckiae]|uniref:hypothetical protein n=1 Tax=Cytobacillus horneckiae TaxID=549687 RepID=UPI0034CE0AA4
MNQLQENRSGGNEPMEATCDNCGDLTRIKYQRNEYPRGLQETYFKCESCDKKFSCFVTDGKVRKMQKDIRKEKDTLVRYNMQTEISTRMKELKRKVNRGI